MDARHWASSRRALRVQSSSILMRLICTAQRYDLKKTAVRWISLLQPCQRHCEKPTPPCLASKHSLALFFFHHRLFLKFVCLHYNVSSLCLGPVLVKKKKKKNPDPRETINREKQPKNNLLLWNDQRLSRAQTRKSGNFYSVLYITLRRISFLLSLRTSLSTPWPLCPPRAGAHYVSSHPPFRLSP